MPLHAGLGEVMAPQTLVTALTVDLQGRVRPDPGALHGRSELERELTWLKARDAVGPSESCWIVWTALELDASQQPIRYKGLTVCELLVNPVSRMAYKSLAEHINRMSEAMRGGVDASKLPAPIRAAIREQLAALVAGAWDRSSTELKAALDG